MSVSERNQLCQAWKSRCVRWRRARRLPACAASVAVTLLAAGFTNARAAAGERERDYGKRGTTAGACGDGVCQSLRHESFLSCPEDCQSLDDRSAALAALLIEEGLELQDGAFATSRPDECRRVENCWFNNPASPYGAFGLPLAPGEPDPDPEDRGGRFPPNDDLLRIFRLAPDEAVIWIGRTPPSGLYFSFTPYVFSRFDPAAAGSSPYGDRKEVFASVGDPVNHMTIATAGEIDGSPFDQETIVIMTGDGGVDAAIRGRLAAAGFSDEMANTLVLPQLEPDGVTPLVRMGYANDADVFTMLMRVAQADGAAPEPALAAWLDDPGAHVFRVRTGEATEPFVLPERRMPGSGSAELGGTLRRLARRIEDTFVGFDTQQIVAVPNEARNGLNCIRTLSECFGDCPDTPYMGARFIIANSAEAVVVAGRDHQASGHASYVSITATRFTTRTAFYSAFIPELLGSADDYLPLDPLADAHWQLMFARDCAGAAYCIEVPPEVVPLDERISILVRAYLDPATATSPKVFPLDDAEIQFPRMIKVSCPPEAENCTPALLAPSAIR